MTQDAVHQVFGDQQSDYCGGESSSDNTRHDSRHEQDAAAVGN